MKTEYRTLLLEDWRPGKQRESRSQRAELPYAGPSVNAGALELAKNAWTSNRAAFLRRIGSPTGIPPWGKAKV